MSVKRIYIGGHFSIDENKEHQEFVDEMLEWLERHGWTFFGWTSESEK